MPNVLRSTGAALVMALALILLAIGNEVLLRDFKVAEGVHWIYLPAGLRMCYVLVLPAAGAAAIFLSTIYMALRDPSLSPGLVVLNAAITTSGAVLARVVALQRLQLKPNLENLSTPMLWKLAALFGLFSTTLHQAFFTGIGREAAFVQMWVGDTLGALLCLYGLKGLAVAARRWWNPS